MPNAVLSSGSLAVLALMLFAYDGSAQARTDTDPAPPDTTRADSIATYVLEPLFVRGRTDDLIGIATTASEGRIGYRDLRLRPIAREGELLESVPGVVMTQHSGDGKANQIFVRGFNLDHGTDFATWVEGMPANVVSHAHGQGYTDLNFLTPEFVDFVEYRLGLAHASVGDFASAGWAGIRLRRSLEAPLARVTLGGYGLRRTVLAWSPRVGSGQLFVGGEAKGYDGPWKIAQDLAKRSGMVRYSWTSGANDVSLLGLGYDARWSASDQIPRRAVADRRVDRFGQIDETLGGSSSRYSLSGAWRRAGLRSSQHLEVYAVRYDLELFSNFTYLLDDPVAGDQIRQNDRARWTTGAGFEHGHRLSFLGTEHTLALGLQGRLDRADVSLSRTDARQPESLVRQDDVRQRSLGVHAQVESRWRSSLRAVLGLRADAHWFDVESRAPSNSGRSRDGLVSPKASLMWNPSGAIELYASGGLGFHSNDARGTVQRLDPVTLAEVAPVDPLVRSRGAELGFRASPAPRWRATAVLWSTALDSELVFVGDAGTTEPRGPSLRIGATVANFYQLTSTVALDVDLALTRARFRGVAEDRSRIPGALERVLTAGVMRDPVEDGVFGALRLRHFGAHPLVEDNTVRGDATSLLSLTVGYQRARARVAVDVLNALNTDHADIQYFYSSRLAGEPAGGVPDVHFKPVEPRRVRLQLSWGL